MDWGALPFSVGNGLLPIRYWYRTGKCLVCFRRVPSFLYLDQAMASRRVMWGCRWLRVVAWLCVLFDLS